MSCLAALAALVITVGAPAPAPTGHSSPRIETAPAPSRIPTGLAAAIHRTLGPGPVTLGAVPPAHAVTPGTRAPSTDVGTPPDLANNVNSIQPAAAATGADNVTSDNGIVRPNVVQTGESTWASSSSPTTTLTNGDGFDTNDYFGDSVALSADGTTALVGAPDVGGHGAAYIFHVTGESTWSSGGGTPITLTRSAPYAGDGFGGSVALSSDGTTAMVGAAGVNGTGAVYVFHVANETSWTSSSSPLATLTNNDGYETGDGFGSAVAFSNDGTVALISADNLGVTGAAYIFHSSGEASWTSSSSPAATLTNGAGTQTLDDFGLSVSLSSDGTTALIGAYGVNGRTGAAYVFHAAAEGSWSSSSSPATLTNGDGAGTFDDVGYSVALSSDGTTALVGAMGLSVAYVYQVSTEGSWASSPTPKATLNDGRNNDADFFGDAVSLSSDGTTALVGAYEVNGITGAAYVFHTTAETAWTSTGPVATLSNGAGRNTFDDFGQSLTLSSDGTTALVGGQGVNGNTGAAYIFYSPTLPAPTLSISNLPTAATYGSSFTPTFSVTSGDTGATSVTSATTSVCTVNGTTGLVSEVGVGTCTLDASVARTTSYLPGTNGADGQSFTVGQATPTLSISNLPTAATYGTSFTPTFSVTSGDTGATSVTSATTSVCTVNGTTGLVSEVGVGTCTLDASVAATTDFTTADNGADGQSFTVGQATWTITVTGTQTYGGSPTFTATPSSGPIGSYTGTLHCTTVNDGVAITPTLTAGGADTINGDSCSGLGLSSADAANYAIAYSGSTFTVGQATPTLSIDNLPPAATYGSTFSPTFSLTTGDTGTISDASATTSVCTVNSTSGLVTDVGVGTCPLDATVTATTDFIAGNNGANGQSFSVAKATLTVTAPSPKVAAGTSIPLLTPTYGGFEFKDTSASLTTAPTCTTYATLGSVPGNYPVTCAGGVSSNYTFSYVAGTLVIAPAFMPSSSTLSVNGCGTYSQTFSTGVGGATFTVLSGSVPGLTLTSGGVLSGTPTKAGHFSLTVKATDPDGSSLTKTYSVTVGLCVGPSTATLPNGTVGRSYSYQLSSSGGTAPYRYQIEKGGFPPTLALSSGGLISGTPSTAGTYSVTVGVLDSGNPVNEGEQTLTITINPA